MKKEHKFQVGDIVSFPDLRINRDGCTLYTDLIGTHGLITSVSFIGERPLYTVQVPGMLVPSLEERLYLISRPATTNYDKDQKDVPAETTTPFISSPIFNVGDTVKLKDALLGGACKGAKAVVIAHEGSGDYGPRIKVVWTDRRSGGQQDGLYYPRLFDRVRKYGMPDSRPEGQISLDKYVAVNNENGDVTGPFDSAKQAFKYFGPSSYSVRRLFDADA